jgi:hypothetical protein
VDPIVFGAAFRNAQHLGGFGIGQANNTKGKNGRIQTSVFVTVTFRQLRAPPIRVKKFLKELPEAMPSWKRTSPGGSSGKTIPYFL